VEHNRAVPAGRADSTQARSGANPPLRILVVDDDDAVRHLKTEVLIQSGCRAWRVGKNVKSILSAPEIRNPNNSTFHL
jgi:hypothetical protein